MTDPPLTTLAAQKPAKPRAAARAADRKVTKHLATGLGGNGDDVELHRARKAGKRARYAAELTRNVLGKKKAKNSIRRCQDPASWS